MNRNIRKNSLNKRSFKQRLVFTYSQINKKAVLTGMLIFTVICLFSISFIQQPQVKIAKAATYEVQSGDYTTIQSAIDAAELAGCTVGDPCIINIHSDLSPFTEYVTIDTGNIVVQANPGTCETNTCDNVAINGAITILTGAGNENINIVAFNGDLKEFDINSLEDLNPNQVASIIITDKSKKSSLEDKLQDKIKEGKVFFVELQKTSKAYKEWSKMIKDNISYDFKNIDIKSVIANKKLIEAISKAN